MTKIQHAARYRLLRHQAQLSQEQFGEQIGASRSRVARCELGRAEYTHSQLVRISELLQMPLAWVMEPDDNQPGVMLADWLPMYFRLHRTGRAIFDTLARAALELATWRSR